MSVLTLGPNPPMGSVAWLTERISNSHSPPPGWKDKMNLICNILVCLSSGTASVSDDLVLRQDVSALFGPRLEAEEAVADAAACQH